MFTNNSKRIKQLLNNNIIEYSKNPLIKNYSTDGKFLPFQVKEKKFFNSFKNTSKKSKINFENSSNSKTLRENFEINNKANKNDIIFDEKNLEIKSWREKCFHLENHLKTLFEKIFLLLKENEILNNIIEENNFYQ